MDQRQAPGIISRVVALAYLALILIYMWMLLIPQDLRQLIRLRLLLSSARVTNRLARRAGAASLSHEARTGVADYTVPYRLSLARVRLEEAYERARGVTC